MNTTNIIVAVLGAASGILAGILAYVKFFAERKDKKKAESFEAILDKKLAPMIERQDRIVGRLDAIEAHNSEQDLELKEIRLDTTRVQLLMLMAHEPHNHDTILKVAHFYLCELGGDWYCTSLLQEWSIKEKVKLPDSIWNIIKIENNKV